MEDERAVEERGVAKSTRFGYLGIGVGGVALLLVVVHFFAGPLSPEPSARERAQAIHSLLKGDAGEPSSSGLDADGLVRGTGALLGALAIVIGVLSFARHEPARVAVGGPLLGAGALAFQFAVLALAAVVLAIVVGIVLDKVGLDVLT